MEYDQVSPPGRTHMADSLRVVLVDEDPDVVDVTREFLEREDSALAVSAVTSPSAAVDRVESGPVDVVVTDHEMPEMTGAQLAATLRDRHPDVSVVLYTAHDRSVLDGNRRERLAGHVRKGTGREQYAELATLIRNVG